MDCLIGCNQIRLRSYPTYNLETKPEYNKSIKVLNRDQDNIVTTISWKPLFRKINMVRHVNVMKKMFLRVRVNYILYCEEPQKTPASWLLL